MPAETPIKRVLIYRLGSLGDMVVALPCLHLIARRFPNAERRLLTNFPINSKAPAAAVVLGESQLVQGYLRYRVGTRNVRELLGLAREVRRFRPDLLVFLTDLRPWKLVRRDLLFFRLCGVGRVVGVESPQEMARRLDVATGMWESEAHRLSRMIAELGDANLDESASWDLRLTEPERRAAVEALGELRGRPLIVCGPGTKMQSKDWGAERWRELVGRLARRYPHAALVLVGSRAEGEMCEAAAQEWTGAKVNLCGLSPRETAALLQHAAVFLGPDSGQMHLAAAVGTPCVIAFSARAERGVWVPAGSGHEVLYRPPPCAGCGLETCIAEKRQCLTAITVEEMEQAVARVLGTA